MSVGVNHSYAFQFNQRPPPSLQSRADEIDLTWLSWVSFGILSSTVLLLVRLLDKEKEANMSRVKGNGKKTNMPKHSKSRE